MIKVTIDLKNYADQEDLESVYGECNDIPSITINEEEKLMIITADEEIIDALLYGLLEAINLGAKVTMEQDQ